MYRKLFVREETTYSTVLVAFNFHTVILYARLQCWSKFSSKFVTFFHEGSKLHIRKATFIIHSAFVDMYLRRTSSMATFSDDHLVRVWGVVTDSGEWILVGQCRCANNNKEGWQTIRQTLQYSLPNASFCNRLYNYSSTALALLLYFPFYCAAVWMMHHQVAIFLDDRTVLMTIRNNIVWRWRSSIINRR